MSGIQGMLLGSKGVPSINYVGTFNTNTSTSSPSFSSINIGNPTNDRLVVVTIGICKDTGSYAGNPISSVSIGGISGTLATYSNAGSSGMSAIYYAIVTTGTSITVSFTLSASAHPIAIDVWYATGLSSTTVSATNTNSSSTTSSSASLAIPSNGFAVGVVASGSVAPTLSSWTNMTQRSSYSQSNGGVWTADYTTSGTATRTVTFTASIAQELCLASWG